MKKFGIKSRRLLANGRGYIHSLSTIAHIGSKIIF